MYDIVFHKSVVLRQRGLIFDIQSCFSKHYTSPPPRKRLESIFPDSFLFSAFPLIRLLSLKKAAMFVIHTVIKIKPILDGSTVLS